MTTTEVPDKNLSCEELTEYADLHGELEVEEYQTTDGWRWRVKDPHNHKNIAPAGQGFHDREESRENFRRLYRLIGGTKAIRWCEVDG